MKINPDLANQELIHAMEAKSNGQKADLSGIRLIAIITVALIFCVSLFESIAGTSRTIQDANLPVHLDAIRNYQHAVGDVVKSFRLSRRVDSESKVQEIYASRKDLEQHATENSAPDGFTLSKPITPADIKLLRFRESRLLDLIGIHGQDSVISQSTLERVEQEADRFDDITSELLARVALNHESLTARNAQQLVVTRAICAISLLLGVWMTVVHWRKRLESQAKSVLISEKILCDTIDKLLMYNTIVNNHAIVAVTDAKGKITQVSDLFCKISQYSREELVGQNHRIINSGVHPRAFWTEMYRDLHQGKTWHGEVCNRAKDGSLYWVDSTMTPVMDSEGQVTSFVAVRIDITARKLAEQAKENADALLRDVTASFPGVIYRFHRRTDGSYHFPYVSEAISRLFPSTPAELAEDGAEAFSRILPEDLTTMLESIATSERELTPWNHTFRAYDLENQVKWVSASSVPARLADGSTEWTGFFLDVTDQKAAEREREAFDERLRKLTAESPGVIYQYRRRPDGTFHFPFTSEGIRGIYGVSPDSVRDDAGPIFTLTHSDDSALVAESIEDSAKNLTRWSCTYRINHPELGIRWLFGTSMPEQQSDGSIIWNGCIVDVTEAKQVEENLRSSDERINIACEFVRMGIWQWEVEPNTLTWNPGMYKLFGVPMTDRQLAYEDFRNAVHPDDIYRVEEFLWAVLEPGGEFNERYRIFGPDGEIVWIHAQAKTEFHPDGTPSRMVGMCIDISAQVQSEQAQAGFEKQMLVLTSEAPGVLYQFRRSPEGEYSFPFVSEGVQTMFGVSPQDVMRDAAEIFRIIHAEDSEAMDASIIESYEEHSRWAHDFRIVLPSGEVRWIYGTSTPEMLADGSTLWNGCLIDMTEKRQVEEEMHVVTERLDLACRTVHMGVWDWDLATGELAWNSKLFEIFGLPYEPESFTYSKFCAHIHPDDLGEVEAGIARALQTDKQYVSQFRIIRADGVERWLSANATVVRQADGSPTRLVGINIDITEKRKADEQLRTANERLSLAVKAFKMGIWDLELATSKVIWDDSMFGLYGIDPIESVGTEDLWEFWKSRVHPEDLGAVLDKFEHSVKNRSDINLEFRVIDADTEIRWISSEAVLIYGENGDPVRYLGVNVDVTQRIVAQDTLRRSEERYALAARGANDALWDWDIVAGTVYYSARWAEMLGISPDFLIQLPEFWHDWVHPEDENGLLRAIDRVMKGEVPFLDSEHRLRCADDTYRWMHARAICTYDSTGKPLRMVGSFADINDRKLAQSELELAASTDRLTGLANRTKFHARLGGVLERFDPSHPESFAVLFLDFDRFKVINDCLGHDVGDQLLKAIAERLNHSVRTGKGAAEERKGNLVARLGGDEFVVLIDRIRSPKDAIVVAERLLKKLSDPYSLGEHVVHTSASIGIVIHDGVTADADQILRDADTAMYEAKMRGKNCHVVFDTKMRERVQARLAMENDLRDALVNEEFSLLYQPIVSLATNEVETLEVLVRWNHPTQGLVSPADFIPTAEDAGLIPALGEWVLRKAAHQLADWTRTHGEKAPKGLSVNVSRKQIQLPDFPRRAKEIVEHAGISPDRIHLEVTESAITMDPKQSLKTLHDLKQIGFGIHLDDFGSGYTSLADIDQFPLDVVKIDKTFITDLCEGGPHIDMVRAICTVAASVGGRVIAEGIENEDQLRMLYYIGVDMIQGYLISRPLPEEAAVEFRCDIGTFLSRAA